MRKTSRRVRLRVPTKLPHVHFEIGTFYETTIAFRATIGLHSTVASCVQVQSASRFERFRAYFALEWPFIGVSL